jgi:hypothetical protein
VRQAVLVLAVRDRGRETLDVAVQLVADRSEPDQPDVVVQLALLDALVIGDEDRSAFIEYPVIWQRSLATLSRGPESVEDAQVVERLQSSSRTSRFGEVQAADLVGRQDVMLVAVHGDAPVAFCDVRGQEQGVIVGQTASPPNRGLSAENG